MAVCARRSSGVCRIRDISAFVLISDIVTQDAFLTRRNNLIDELDE